MSRDFLADLFPLALAFLPRYTLISKMKIFVSTLLLFPLACSAASDARKQEEASLRECAKTVLAGFRKIAQTRDQRFEGKVQQATALCRGGQRALQFQLTPWVDWSQYWGTGDQTSRPHGLITEGGPSLRGVNGALIDLEYQRIELIKFNLFDNNGTYSEYIRGRDGQNGASLKHWAALRLPSDHPSFGAVGGDSAQVCRGALIRARTLTGICNDLRNPLMGSTGQMFARNVEFETTFPELGQTELTRNRHGDRLGLLTPDPQVISRKLFTRRQSDPNACHEGFGLPNNPVGANCDYQKAPSFNVLAAYWIQFMTHDWFSHLEEGQNGKELMKVGCESQRAGNVETHLTASQVAKLGCRPDDRIDRSLVANASAPAKFTKDGHEYLSRAPQVARNTNTAWWDSSQIYGYDERSLARVKREPADHAKLLLERNYLPLFAATDPIRPEWKGQESSAFPDNWTIGMSFYHNVFSREHNAFVDEFRRIARATPNADSGLRNPQAPKQVIRYRDVTFDELFDAARLVVSAEIAKIHTTEWTPQLLYNEPLNKAMNANWNGLLGSGNAEVSKVLGDLIVHNFGKSKDVVKSNQWYSVFASGPGIFGLGSRISDYDMSNPDHVNGGVNHFGVPFNFPEEFVTVYRLHPLIPDLIEYRDFSKDPNHIAQKVPVVETFRAKATDAMRSGGLANWGLSLGRQRLGLLTLHNHPLFMQNLKMGRLDSSTQKIDIAALDIIRDREHGVPRFNEFRRQYGLRQLTSFDDFVDQRATSAAQDEQRKTVSELREVYGQHVCDASKVITDAQRNPDNSLINDCLGKANGTLIDNIEDVDTIVGWLAESTRPHGFAISETQFVVFILNASRRLFSDRFFTSSFRPEFYTQLGVDWVNHNGPGPERMEQGAPNGHTQPVSPMKRVLMRTIPELQPELQHVINAFDPWARDRGQYYSLDWTPRPDARSDEAFPKH